MNDAAWSHALLQVDASVPLGWCATNGSDPQVRFDVYRNNVWASWVQALADSYPVLHLAMGDALFREMAVMCLRDQPPADSVLAHYGEGVADFLQRLSKGSPANAALSVAWWPDLARLEYARVQSFHAAELPALSMQTVQDLLAQPQGLDEVVFIFQPCVQLLHSDWPISRLWQMCQEEHEARPVSSQPAAESVLVCRHEWDVMMVPMTTASGYFIDQLRQGSALGVAAQVSLSQDASFDLPASLALLLRHGCLSAAHRTHIPTMS